jgi:hypothetical protein
MSLSSLPIIGLLLVLVCLTGLVYLWVRVLRKPRQVMPSCGHCGYFVEGLQTLTCPECGSDFRKVGINKPDRHGIRPVLFVTAWTLLLGLSALILTPVAIAYGPRHYRGTMTYSFAPYSHSFGTVKVQARLEITSLYSLPPWAPGGGGPINYSSSGINGLAPMTTSLQRQSLVPKPDSLILTMTPSGSGTAGPYEMTVDPGTLHYRLSQTGMKMTASNKPLDAEAIEQWLASSGTTSNLPVHMDEATDLFNFIEYVLNRRTSFHTNRFLLGLGHSVSIDSPSWFGASVWACWVALYILGLRLYLGICRRRLRPEEPPGGLR